MDMCNPVAILQDAVPNKIFLVNLFIKSLTTCLMRRNKNILLPDTETDTQAEIQGDIERRI